MKLQINKNKTKVMIFNRGGKLLSNNNFTYNDSSLQLCNQYKYLGILFVPSGSFTKSIDNFKDKASKAFFKIREKICTIVLVFVV